MYGHRLDGQQNVVGVFQLVNKIDRKITKYDIVSVSKVVKINLEES